MKKTKIPKKVVITGYNEKMRRRTASMYFVRDDNRSDLWNLKRMVKAYKKNKPFFEEVVKFVKDLEGKE